MNLVVIGITTLAAGLFIGSAVSFASERTGWRFVQLLGSVGWVIVVLTHVAESNHLLPEMGWGLPDSPGHYIDLCSAILGLIALPLGYTMARRGNSVQETRGHADSRPRGGG